MKNKLFNNTILFILLTIVCSSILLPHLITDTPFLLGYDVKNQYYQFYELLVTAFQEGNLFYHFTQFLGNDFYSSRLFLNYDVFDYIFAFLNVDYFTAATLGFYFRCLVGGFSFYYFAHNFNKNNNINILWSIFYVFSSWALFNLKDNFFFSFYCFLPLYFIGIEHYFKSNKKVLFIVMTAYLAVDNYYLFYTVAFFTVIYFLYRYYSIHNNYIGVVQSALRLIAYFIIGVCISGFSLIPSILHIIQSDRIGDTTNLIMYDSIKVYLQVFTSLFNFTSIFGNQNAGLIYNLDLDNTIIWVNFMSSLIVSILLIQTLVDHKYSKKKETRLLMFILIVFSLIPLFSSVVHGMSAPNYRWTFFVIFFSLIVTLQYTDEKDMKIESRLIKWISAFSGIMLIIYLFGFSFGLVFSKYEQLVCIVTIFMIMIYTVLLFKNKIRSIFILSFIEIIVVSYLSVFGNSNFRNIDMNTWNRYESILGNKNELNSVLNSYSNDTEFYRVYLNHESTAWSISLNTNLLYNIQSVSGYDSSYSPSIDKLDVFSNFRWDLDWMMQITDKNLLEYLNVKYAIVANENQLPSETYTYVGDYKGLYIYENNEYFNLGMCTDKVITYESVENSTDILNYIVVDEEDYDEIKSYITPNYDKYGLDYVYQYDNRISAETNMDEKGFVATSIPYNKGFKVVVNGQEIKTYEVNGGFIGFALEKGYNLVDIYFLPYGLKAGGIISFVGVTILLGILFVEKDKGKNRRNTRKLKK